MAAKTTQKVAILTGAAKDDLFSAAATGLSEDGSVANLAVLGNDPGAAKLYSLQQNTTTLAAGTQLAATASAVSASGAVISINTDGTVHYDASGLNLQSLAQGETFTDTFTYTVQMGNGALSTAVATVQIAGANDAPVLASVAAAVFHDDAAAAGPVGASGLLAASDADHGASLAFAFSGASALGSLTLDAATGAYSFEGVAAMLDALKAGEHASANYNVTVTDEFGAQAAQTLSFEFIGANDTAVLGGQTAGAVSEDGTLQAGGTVTVADRDAGEAAFQAVDSAALAGTYGNFSFDAASGAWTYTLNNDAANVQALHNNETVSDSLVVASVDGSSETITVSVMGTNEAAHSTPVSDPVNPADTFRVTNGQQAVNGRQIFTGFDSNDELVYANNMQKTGISFGDTDNDGKIDSIVGFEITKGHNTSSFEVVLIGYAGLTDAQVHATNL
ncbi:VCBS domain-containing protein [Pseudoduganella sp. LjRoot289]|uniref:VCBS domain-containing protein n=1 Tax=Pseudoduganella sp. LjRoot289 TaxID=3342314 RepID=UPI003ED00192